MMNILLVSGDGGASQGWGDFSTTREIQNAIQAMGHNVEIYYVQDKEKDDFISNILRFSPDLVWSALYHLDQHSNMISFSDTLAWVSDILDEHAIPYVGSESVVLKNMLDKHLTNKILKQADIPVPSQIVIEIGAKIPEITFPAIVKPRYESESKGISESSVVNQQSELTEKVKWIHSNYFQSALVETYLPGVEITTLVIGHGAEKITYPVSNIVSNYKKYPLVTQESKRSVSLSTIKTEEHYNSAIELASEVSSHLNISDITRIDMRACHNGDLHVIEVNGIPGLTPKHSRSLKIHQMYNTHLTDEENFHTLISLILQSAMKRNKIYPCISNPS